MALISSESILENLVTNDLKLNRQVASIDTMMQATVSLQGNLYLMYGLLRVAEAIEQRTKLIEKISKRSAKR